jgi:plasmid stabilization system protein ParE
MKHLFHPDAEEELLEAVRYYAAIDSDLGIRFYLEMERLIREICNAPERFHRFAPPARRHFGRTFPHTIIYLDEPDHVWIVAVMHMKRRPHYWQDRIDTN